MGQEVQGDDTRVTEVLLEDVPLHDPDPEDDGVERRHPRDVLPGASPRGRVRGLAVGARARLRLPGGRGEEQQGRSGGRSSQGGQHGSGSRGGPHDSTPSQLEQVAEPSLTLNQGTLHPALVRLEQKGWIKGVWQRTESNREAKYYSITPDGCADLRRRPDRSRCRSSSWPRPSLPSGPRASSRWSPCESRNPQPAWISQGVQDADYDRLHGRGESTRFAPLCS